MLCLSSKVYKKLPKRQFPSPTVQCNTISDHDSAKIHLSEMLVRQRSNSMIFVKRNPIVLWYMTHTFVKIMQNRKYMLPII